MPGRKSSTPVRNAGRETALRVGYKVRRAGDVTSLTLPASLAQSIPENARFLPELTTDGILFRRVKAAESGRLPSWANRARKR